MSLFKKMFGDKDKGVGSKPPSTGFQDSDDPQETASSRSAPRREVVHLVLRETMRRHGIPSDWLDCRILTVMSRTQVPGAHLTLIVKGGQDRLLSYVPAFQSSLTQGLHKFDPRIGDWLLSLSWQFDGLSDTTTPAMPDPATWAGPKASEPASPAQEVEEDLEQDLRALFAIRDAALRDDIRATDFEPTQPGQRPGAP